MNKTVTAIGKALATYRGWNYNCPHCKTQAFLATFHRKHEYCPNCGKPIQFNKSDIDIVLNRVYEKGDKE